jgi:hypothetical protein
VWWISHTEINENARLIEVFVPMIEECDWNEEETAKPEKLQHFRVNRMKPQESYK